jgi:hypothetical protein
MAAGFASTVVARPARANRAVVQGLSPPDIIRHAENEQAGVHQNNLQREAGQFTAARRAAG